MKNKKGDIPIVVLVLGVFFICMMVLGSFFFFQNRINRTFVGTGIIEKAIAVEDKYYFYKSTEKFSEQDIEEILGIQIEEGRRYIFIEEKTRQGIFGLGEEKVVAYVKYYLP
ncbi:MAG: hypothetical protein Q7S06_03180 [Nanoarchaeota archaeon]|nr:hypothetical protein [Nanoarchaeota archaeon]